MDTKIQELTDKIYKEGVEKGNEEAGRIIADANAQKQAIVSEAEAEAKHIVAAGLAEKCEIQIGYSIGVAKPVSILVDTFNTGKVTDDILENWIEEHFDLRPSAIIEKLDLRRPIYTSTSAYGHFGYTDVNHTWELIDEALVNSAKRLIYNNPKS